MSTAIHNLPRPKSYEDARNEFLRAMGDPRQLNKLLAGALIGVLLLAGGLLALQFKTTTQQHERIVVRIDDVGRAQAVGYAAPGYKVQPVEAKYFLGQFITDYYGRNRATIYDTFARSMLFLDAKLAAIRREDEHRNNTIGKFIVGSDEDIEIHITNIVLDNLSSAPYNAQVDLEKIFRARGGTEARIEKYVVGVRFTIASDVPNAAIPVNPLGFVIVQLIENQAF